MRILIVDDEIEQLDVLKDFFESEAYNAITTENPLHAIQLLSTTKIDCAILDLKMPVLEGQHLLTVIKEKYPEIPVIILSACISDDEELFQKGAYASLQKPADLKMLLSTVENAINESSNSIRFVFNELDLPKIKDKVIARLVALALKKTRGNQQKAAEILGISRQCLIRYMKKFSIVFQ